MAKPASRTRTPVRVPPVSARHRIPEGAIKAAIRQIIERFQPERIILFGSYARGRPRPNSDVDLLVILNSSLGETDQAARICQAIEYHFGLDLFVRTPATLARRLALGDPFLREVVATGKVLYARADS
jgi:uncharacterized protein